MKKSIYSSDQEALQVLLRQVRKESGLSQKQLAEKLGTLQTIVSNYEIGERRLDILELRQICTALGITFAGFMDRLEKMLSQDTDDTVSKQEDPETIQPGGSYVSQNPQGGWNRFVNVTGHLTAGKESDVVMTNEGKSEDMPEHGPLVEEREFFAEQLPVWLQQYNGQVALIKRRELIGVYSTKPEAIAEGARRFGTEDHLIRRIDARRPTIFAPSLGLGIISGDLTYATLGNRKQGE